MDSELLSQVILASYSRFKQAIIDINKYIGLVTAINSSAAGDIKGFCSNFDNCYRWVMEKRMIFLLRDIIDNSLNNMKEIYAKLLYVKYIKFFSSEKCKRMFNMDSKTYLKRMRAAHRAFFREFSRLGYSVMWFKDNCMGVSCVSGTLKQILENKYGRCGNYKGVIKVGKPRKNSGEK